MDDYKRSSDSKINELHKELLDLLAESQKLSERTLKIQSQRKKRPKVQMYVPVIFSEDEDDDIPTLTDAEFDQLLFDIQRLPRSTIDVLKLMLQQLEGNLKAFEGEEIVFNIRHLKKSTLRIMKSYVDSKLQKPTLNLELKTKRLPRTRRVLKKNQTLTN